MIEDVLMNSVKSTLTRDMATLAGVAAQRDDILPRPKGVSKYGTTSRELSVGLRLRDALRKETAAPALIRPLPTTPEQILERAALPGMNRRNDSKVPNIASRARTSTIASRVLSDTFTSLNTPRLQNRPISPIPVAASFPSAPKSAIGSGTRTKGLRLRAQIEKSLNIKDTPKAIEAPDTKPHRESVLKTPESGMDAFRHIAGIFNRGRRTVDTGDIRKDPKLFPGRPDTALPVDRREEGKMRQTADVQRRERPESKTLGAEQSKLFRSLEYKRRLMEMAEQRKGQKLSTADGRPSTTLGGLQVITAKSTVDGVHVAASMRPGTRGRRHPEVKGHAADCDAPDRPQSIHEYPSIGSRRLINRVKAPKLEPSSVLERKREATPIKVPPLKINYLNSNNATAMLYKRGSEAEEETRRPPGRKGERRSLIPAPTWGDNKARPRPST